jgi:hypothetical protein
MEGPVAAAGVDADADAPEVCDAATPFEATAVVAKRPPPELCDDVDMPRPPLELCPPPKGPPSELAPTGLKGESATAADLSPSDCPELVEPLDAAAKGDDAVLESPNIAPDPVLAAATSNGDPTKLDAASGAAGPAPDEGGPEGRCLRPCG